MKQRNGSTYASKSVLLLLYCTTCITLFANQESSFIPIASLESWGSYSIDEENSQHNYDDRADFQLRRLRFGAKGSVYDGVSYSFMFHNDRLGESPYAATKGSNSGVGLWSAMATINPFDNSLFHIHTGYFQAVSSRESNTSPWAVSSLDKSQADWYLRKFITGKGNGIESGAGIGGLYQCSSCLSISYRASAHNPAAFESPQESSLLYTGRFMLSLGDAEQKKYSYMLSGSQWGKRKGVTLGAGGSYKGKTDTQDESNPLSFNRSSTYGGDIRADFLSFALDGEFYKMSRDSKFNATCWHIRASYLFTLSKYYLEPSLMYAYYEGSGEKDLFSYIGDDITYDVGINCYFNREKLKASFHYVIQEGDASSNSGDYIATALQLKI